MLCQFSLAELRLGHGRTLQCLIIRSQFFEANCHDLFRSLAQFSFLPIWFRSFVVLITSALVVCLSGDVVRRIALEYEHLLNAFLQFVCCSKGSVYRKLDYVTRMLNFIVVSLRFLRVFFDHNKSRRGNYQAFALLRLLPFSLAQMKRSWNGALTPVMLSFFHRLWFLHVDPPPNHGAVYALIDYKRGIYLGSTSSDRF